MFFKHLIFSDSGLYYRGATLKTLGESLGDFTQLLPAVSTRMKLLSLLLLMNKRSRGGREGNGCTSVRARTAAVNDCPGLPRELGAAWRTHVGPPLHVIHSCVLY